MKYRNLGNSGLKVPVVCFGAWAIGGWMWGGTDEREAVRALQHALDCGITCIDTAPAYGFGLSEQLVGQAIKGRREEVVVATKCGLRWDQQEGEFFFDTTDAGGRPWKIFRNLRGHSIEYEVEASLNRLGIDCIDLYQCHWPDATTPIGETMEALERLKEMGKIREYGVSNFSREQLREAVEHGAPVSDQPKYNALERDAEREVLPFCREHGLGVLAYSPIAQGLLTGKVGSDRVFPEGDTRKNKALFRTENRQRVNEMLDHVRPIADTHRATLGQLFIAWLLAQPGVTSALVGARSPQQVEENAAAAEITLTPEEVATIRREVESLPLALT